MKGTTKRGFVCGNLPELKVDLKHLSIKIALVEVMVRGGVCAQYCGFLRLGNGLQLGEL